MKDEGPFVEMVGTGPRWCVECRVLGRAIEFLIDTGASPNILSSDIYYGIPTDQRPELHPSDKILKVANGEHMRLCGETMLTLAIGGKIFQVPMIIAETGNLRGILGMQFLTENRCIVDVGGGVLEINGEKIEMNQLDGPKLCRIVLTESLHVDGYQEVMVEGHVEGVRWDSSEAIGVVEPCETFATETGLVIPRAVVQRQGDRVLLTVANVGNDRVDVERGKVMALLHPVDSVEEIGMVDSQEGKGQSKAVGSKGDLIPCSASDLPAHLQGMVEGISELDSEQFGLLCGLLKEYEGIFMTPDGKLGRTGLVKHQIDTEGARPIKQPTRRLPIRQKHIVEEEIKKMLDNDVIQPSQSPWASPVVLVTKKDGSIRFCVDYRRLNQVTRKDAYPLPNINDCIDTLSGSKWFSTLDLASGYWQVLMDEESKPLTAFTTHKGLYEFKVLAFGLTNAPAVFERLMEQVLRGLQWEKCLVYLDDIIILGSSFDKQLENLRLVFDRIHTANLKLKPKKCNFFRREVAFLGHVVTTEGVACDPEKTKAVSDWEIPQSVTEVRSFLGLASYYRRFIKSFSTIASPLTALTKKGQKFEWSSDCQTAFETLKSRLTEAPILAYPSSNPADKFILDTDASDSGIGGVLSQVQDGVERVVAYASNTLSPSERRYCTTYRELLAVVVFMKKFRHYLMGQKFVVRTDHSSLRWLTNFKETEGMVGRWLSAISPFSYTIEHRSGVNHGNADGLSRKMIKDKRRRCGRDECPECPPGSASYVPTVDAVSDSLGDIHLPVACLTLIEERVNQQTADAHETNSVNDERRTVPLTPVVDMTTDATRGRPPEGQTDDNPSGDSDPGSRSLEDTVPEARLSNVAYGDGSTVNPGEALPVNWCTAWSNNELIEMQNADNDIAKVAGWVGNRRDPPSKTDLLAESDGVRALCAQWGKLVVRGQLLYRQWQTKHDQTQDIFQLVTPRKLQSDIFSQLHHSRVGGHLGISKTLENVRRRFYWPGCKSDIRRWCQTCSSCAQIKPGPRHRTRLKQIVASNPLDCVAIDLLGELPETENGNRYILVVTDYFTKWTQAFALRNMTAQTVADRLSTEFFCFFGTPRQLHSDQGRQFESQLFQEICKLLGINKTRTTPYRPQSDGMVERFNRTIQQMLKHFVNNNRNDWDDHLPYLMMAYRASQHESTGCSPNLLMLGREVSVPLDVLVGRAPDKVVGCQTEYVEWLRDSMATAFDYARRQLKKSALRQKRLYDLKSIEASFNTGQFVWRWYPPKANVKLGKGWTGPFRVMSRPTEVNAVIRYRPNDKDIRVHLDHLKTYQGDIPDIWKGFSDPDADLTSSESLDNVVQDRTLANQDILDPDIPQHDEVIPANLDNRVPTYPVTNDHPMTVTSEAWTGQDQTLRRSHRHRKPPDRLDL